MLVNGGMFFLLKAAPLIFLAVQRFMDHGSQEVSEEMRVRTIGMKLKPTSSHLRRRQRRILDCDEIRRKRKVEEQRSRSLTLRFI